MRAAENGRNEDGEWTRCLHWETQEGNWGLGSELGAESKGNKDTKDSPEMQSERFAECWGSSTAGGLGS